MSYLQYQLEVDMDMDHGLAHMIERSRHHADRFRARLAQEPAGEVLERAELIEDAANALLACQFVAVRGGLFARAHAARLMTEIGERVRAAGLESAIVARLQHKLGSLGTMFTQH
jgi:hypothetical protein